MLLAREDHFLILADGVVSDRPAKLEYCSTLPLAAQVSFRPATETHDGLLAQKKPLALVLPLALPEWRSDSRSGTLKQAQAGLELSQQTSARSLWAPLFFDLQPRRFSKPFTWRHLTVAENLLAQPADVAVGYRVTIGKDQWLLYRSLGPKGNRTLLGHNLVSRDARRSIRRRRRSRAGSGNRVGAGGAEIARERGEERTLAGMRDWGLEIGRSNPDRTTYGGELKLEHGHHLLGEGDEKG